MSKSHSVSLALQVVLNNEVYAVKELSATEVGIVGFDTNKVDGKGNIAARLVLPIVDSSLILKVKLHLKEERENTAGFEFYDLLENHKRVLRHYVVIFVSVGMGIFHNLYYRTSSTGVVINNNLAVTANRQGILAKVYVKQDSRITPGTKLFYVEDEPLKENLANSTERKHYTSRPGLQSSGRDVTMWMGAI